MKVADRIISSACWIFGFFQLVLALFACNILRGGETDPFNWVLFFIFFLSSAALILAGWRMSRLARGKKNDTGATRPPVPPNPATTGNDGPERAEALTSLLCSSNDLMATLSDLAANPKLAHDPASTRLAALLSRMDLPSYGDLPTLTCTRLTRTGQFWIPTHVEPDDYTRVFSVEAALNLALAEDPESLLANLKTLGPTAWRPRVPYPTDDSVEGSADQPEHGEWELRLGMANYIESLPCPLRIQYEYMANVSAGVACADITLPNADYLSCLDGNPSRIDRLVTVASLHMCLLVAKAAFSSSTSLERVIVNGNRRADKSTLISLDLTREMLGRLMLPDRTDSNAPRPEQGLLRIRMSTGADGELSPVEPFMRLSDPVLARPDRQVKPELDHREASLAMGAACGAQRIADIGIDETAQRKDIAERVLSAPTASTEELVSALMAARNDTDDIATIEACERTSKALVTGELDATDYNGIKRSIVSGSSLDKVLEGIGSIGATSEPAVLERALSTVEKALSPIDSLGLFDDDSECVYRYFLSIPERIAYNLETVDDARRVVLVPQSYFEAHLLASRINSTLGRHEEALSHVLVLDRIAPRTLEGRMAHAMALSAQSKWLEEEALVRSLIPLANTSGEASFVFYRLAYLECLLGNKELGAACYLRSTIWPGRYAEYAKEELSQLLKKNEDLKAPDTAAEVAEILKRNGIPEALSPKLLADLGTWARVTCDEGCFPASSALLNQLYDVTRDDALVPMSISMLRYAG